jgi:hypothetical protein
MRVQRRTNLLLGFVALALALIALAGALGAFPAAIYDLILRAWPALLILFGLAALLRGRVPFGGGLALLLTAVAVAGVAAYAYSSRAGEQRTDNEQTLAQDIPEGTPLLRLRVAALATDVEILRGTAADSVNVRFTGSTESQLTSDFEQSDDGSVTLTVGEARPNPFPLLEAVGRGSLRVDVPPGVPLDVEFRGTDGAVTLNMSGTALERLNVNLPRGDVLVALPEYDPVLSEDDATLGTLAAMNGDITVIVPEAVGGRFELNRAESGIQPEYDPARYNFLVGDILEARTIETADIVQRYTITAPRGQIRLDTPGA